LAIGDGHDGDGHRPGSYGGHAAVGPAPRSGRASSTPRSEHVGMTAMRLNGGTRPGRGDDDVDAGLELDRGGVENEVIVAGGPRVALVEVLHVRLAGAVGLDAELAGPFLVELLERRGPLHPRLGRSGEPH